MFKLHKYPYIQFLLINFYLILCAHFGWGKYVVPQLKLEAFKDKGFRVSIPSEPGVKLFAFHGRLNGMIKKLEMGEFTQDVCKETNKFLVYENTQLELHVGDYITYWAYVQHEYQGYYVDVATWHVQTLVENIALNCQNSESTVNGKSVCQGSLIFHESFSNIDDEKWVIEKYIPVNGPNFEFNYYTPESVCIEDGNLKITPIAKTDESDLRGTLNLTDGCTRTNHEECLYKQRAALYLPPIKSGKIRTKLNFKYGKIEIVAKLPCGDWIFPELCLHPTDIEDTSRKIYIAYSRGNRDLIDVNGLNIGNNLLFSGPCTSAIEPNRSEYLKTMTKTKPFGEDFHLYAITWKPDEIISSVDGEILHKIDVRNSFTFNDNFNAEFYLSLGISVGGINDFPNECLSGKYKKPWQNKDLKQIKNFFEARKTWLPTWSNDTSCLEIDSVRIYAL